MKFSKKIPPEVAALIPCGQLEFTKRNMRVFQGTIQRLETALKLCPAIGATEWSKERLAIFHYFYDSTNILICEFDQNDLMFGCTILDGDLLNSRWGYISLLEITHMPQCHLNFHFPVQTMEAVLYNAYPDYFKKPQSLM